MLKMELPQESLEEAIRQYVSGTLGLNLPVAEINFTAQRSNGNKILTELMVGAAGTEATPTKKGGSKLAEVPKPAAPAQKDEPETEEEEETPPPAAAEAKEEPTAEAESDDAEAEEPAAVPAGKSLFG